MIGVARLVLYGYEFLAGFVPFLVVWAYFARQHRLKGTSEDKAYRITVLLFGIYLLGVYHVTGAGTVFDLLRYPLGLQENQINLFPFSDGYSSFVLMLNGLNVVLFIPLGFFMPFICKKGLQAKEVILTGFSFSLLIELSQLLNNRVSDIDDLICNSLGALIGFVCYKIFAPKKRDLVYFSKWKLNIYIVVTFLGRFFLFNEMGLAKILYQF